MSVATELSLRAPPGRPGSISAPYREEHVTERVRRALSRERATTVGALALRLADDPGARIRLRRSRYSSGSVRFGNPRVPGDVPNPGAP